MKKIFTLVSIALCAMSANAQTESWTVTEVVEGETVLKADYVPNADASAMSVVSFSTANVEGTHTSGPVSGYKDINLGDGEQLPEDGKLEAIYDNGWNDLKRQKLDLESENAGTDVYFYYVQGKGNPVDISKVGIDPIYDGTGENAPIKGYRADWTNAYYAFDGSNGLPTNGTYLTFTPKVDGVLTARIYVLKGNRDVYVVKASDAKALRVGQEITANGYINNTKTVMEENATKGEEGTDAFVLGGGQNFWGTLSWNAVKGETYYVFCKNTQVGFSGFEFTPGKGTGIENVENAEAAKVAPKKVVKNGHIMIGDFNIAGQRVK